MKDSRMYLGLM